MINIYLDLETIPSQSQEYRGEVRKNITPPGNIKKPESIQKWMDENADNAADEVIAKTSFDPARGHICCIGFAVGDGPLEDYSMENIEDEPVILERFFNALPDIAMPCFIGHNVGAFDMRFILCRAIVLGVKIPALIPRDIKPWSESIFDTMTAWAGTRGTISLDNLAKALGVQGKGDFDGSMVAAAWANGEHDKIAEYCRSDVDIVRQIHRKFEAVGF